MAKDEQNMVTVRLYMGDLPQTKVPVDVWVNGEKYTVPRGKAVKVPDFVAAVLDDVETARMEILEYNEKNKPE